MVIVRLSDGEEIRLTGQMAEAIRWLVEKAAEIEASAEANVIIAFSPHDIRPSLRRFDRPIKVKKTN